MAVTWQISHAERLVTARCTGSIVLPDVERYLDDVIVSDALPYAKIFDTGEANWALTDADMLALGARIRAYPALSPIFGPIAIIAASDKLYEHAQTFAVLAEVNRPLKIFRAADAARKWLATFPT
ncbi:MAG: hypothetical protein JSR47_09645 [Proteobacteria bacterium]|nr:hypothetical protein [Pseudomonadota bacterium]